MGNSKKNKALFTISGLFLVTVSLVGAGTGITSVLNKFTEPEPQTQVAKPSDSNTKINNMPTTEQLTFIENSVNYKLKNMQYNGHGAYIINNNKSTLVAKNNTKPFASNQVDSKKRPTTADAFITKQTRQYKNREETNNGRSNWTPLGWHQLTNLPGKYKYAYNRGHLLGYALVGNIKGYDASESNEKNIITQTSWANQANSPTNTGQNYYESLVRKAADKNKKIRYQVKAIYSKSDYNIVPYGTQIQAKSTDNSLEFNVFIPNAQGNINIDYDSGKARPNY